MHMIGPAINYLVLLPKLIGTFAYAYVSPEVKTKYKVGALAGMVYFFSPIDLVPDFFTGIGLIDDLILALIIMQGFLLAIPEETLAPAFKKFGTSRRELSFDVEKAVVGICLTAKALYYAVSLAKDKIIDHYGRGSSPKLSEARKMALGMADCALEEEIVGG